MGLHEDVFLGVKKTSALPTIIMPKEFFMVSMVGCLSSLSLGTAAECANTTVSPASMLALWANTINASVPNDEIFC